MQGAGEVGSGAALSGLVLRPGEQAFGRVEVACDVCGDARVAGDRAE